MGAFKDAHGGALRNLYLEADAAEAAKRGSGERKSWDLTDRQLCDLELLMNGGFSPLEGFLGQADYESVLESMRLSNGLPWSLPVCLAVDGPPQGDRIALADESGTPVAVLEVEGVYDYDKEREAELTYRTIDQEHPGVAAGSLASPGNCGVARSKTVTLPARYIGLCP